MKITWFGRSSFLIETAEGKKILTDPFNYNMNSNIINKNVNILTLSHNYFNDKIPINLKNKIINTTGMFNFNDILVQGLPSYCDKIKGTKRGENIIFIFKIDNYTICNLGALGHTLSNTEIDRIGSIDILFVPVGGNFTIDGKEAASLCKKINSRIVIPMNFNIHKLYFNIKGVEPFIKEMKNGERIQDHTLQITNKLTCINKVKVLNPIDYCLMPTNN